MKQYWITTLTVFIGAAMVILAILAMLFGEDMSGVAVNVLLALLMVMGALTLVGVVNLRRGHSGDVLSLSLIGVGVAAFGLAWFWMLFIPSALALVVLWFGIVKGGLVRELRPVPDAGDR